MSGSEASDSFVSPVSSFEALLSSDAALSSDIMFPSEEAPVSVLISESAATLSSSSPTVSLTEHTSLKCEIVSSVGYASDSSEAYAILPPAPKNPTELTIRTTHNKLSILLSHLLFFSFFIICLSRSPYSS